MRRRRRRKRKGGLNALDYFVIEARRQGLTYAQAQIRETCEMLRMQEIKKRLMEERRKEQASRR